MPGNSPALRRRAFGSVLIRPVAATPNRLSIVSRHGDKRHVSQVSTVQWLLPGNPDGQ